MDAADRTRNICAFIHSARQSYKMNVSTKHKHSFLFNVVSIRVLCTSYMLFIFYMKSVFTVQLRQG